MKLEEARVTQLQSSHPALSFIDDFLLAHKTANLYLVGGAIRDALLSRPMQERDYDFVVTGLPVSDLERWFTAHGELHLVGQHFGVYKFMPTGFTSKDIAFIDIALPRTEAVSKGSLGGYRDFDIQSDPTIPIETDLARRDFTINAIALDLRTHLLIDPFNGQIDLTQKVLRAVGKPEERFTEDLTRILRGIRFASELGFDIEPDTNLALKSQIERLNILREIDDKIEYVVPREVVGIELAKALSRNPVEALHAFVNHRVIEMLFPEVHALISKDQDYLAPLAHIKPNELTLVLAIILRACTKEVIVETLSFTGLNTLPRGSSLRTEQEQILWLVSMSKELNSQAQIREMRASVFEKRFMNGKGLLLMRTLELLGKKEIAQSAKKRRQEIEDRWIVDHDESIAPLISGQDILSTGISPGPEVRLLLDEVRDLQLDGTLMRREDALKWIAGKQF
ncbi:CCA tRNA nucleotidyltransferase [Candidatus Uhrbacteria bacterium]|nr:CCA tRNA nucleotidyltransferase [Candidatus Uhrbacteria bacterium]